MKVQSGTLLGNSKVKEKNQRQIVIRDVTNFCIWYVYLNIMIVYVYYTYYKRLGDCWTQKIMRTNPIEEEWK